VTLCRTQYSFPPHLRHGRINHAWSTFCRISASKHLNSLRCQTSVALFFATNALWCLTLTYTQFFNKFLHSAHESQWNYFGIYLQLKSFEVNFSWQKHYFCSGCVSYQQCKLQIFQFMQFWPPSILPIMALLEATFIVRKWISLKLSVAYSAVSFSSDNHALYFGANKMSFSF